FSDDGTVNNEFMMLQESLSCFDIPLRVEAIASRSPVHQHARVTIDHTGRLFPMYGAEDGTAYLVRPDGHVLARWKQAHPEEVSEAILRVINLASIQ
ncbi:MAG TPA: FAD-dependent oxidoreductase, partial [Casimicrobium sp.]|nr:FAD-dependent oxidoreductase [Casimicrobium sp.]